MSAITRTVASWQVERINLLHGVTRPETIEAFQTVGRLAPPEIVSLYKASTGMTPEGEVDSAWFSLWPLTAALRRYAENPTQFFGFGEGFLSANRYSFLLKDTDKTAVYGDYFDDNFIKLTDSVEEFFECLLTQPKKIWLPS